MCRGLTARWSAFGAVLMLTVALSNTSCCSHRKAVSESRSEATEQVSTTLQSESRSEEQHAATLTNRTERQGETVTEIEVYDTTQPTDSTTGRPPVKARIRQRHRENGTEESRATEAGQSSTATEAESAATYQGGTLDEVTVTATKSPGLWERLKQGAAWAAAIMILTAAGYIIYKLKKRKTT